MSVAGLFEELSRLGAHLTLDGDRLRLSAPKGAISPDLQGRIKTERDAIIAALESARARPERAPVEPIPAFPEGDPVPLSDSQRRLWFVNELNPDSPPLNIPGCLHLAGPIDVDALRFAVGELGRRHDALRTAIVLVGGAPHGVLRKSETILELEDLSDVPEPERSRAIRARCFEEGARPFRLSEAPMARFFLFRAGPEDHTLLFSASHLVFDGVSHDILFSDLKELYEARLQGKPVPPHEGVRFRDFVRFHRAWQSRTDQRGDLEYWRTRLSGMPTVLELPTDRPRAPVMSYRGNHAFATLEGPLFAALMRTARASGVTLSMLGLAALELLLARYSGQEDFGVGVAVQGRAHPDVERVIGVFVNMVVLRSDVPQGGTFRELALRVRDSSLEALAHQDVPFDRVVQVTRPVRESNRTPLYQAMFTHQRANARDGAMGGLVVTDVPTLSPSAPTDITVLMFEYDDRVTLAVETASDLFDNETTERHVQSWRRILEAVAVEPDLPLRDVPVLSTADLHTLLVELNETQSPWDESALIEQLFERAVDEKPHETALLFEEERSTFRELDRRANRLAHWLRKRGIGPDVLVGVYLLRTPELVVALLAILKAGGAYVPLDPTYPADRVEYVLADSKAKLLVSTHDLAARLRERPDTLLLDRGADAAAIAQEPDLRLPVEPRPDRLAYVIYTSGSTGKPKGVMVEQRNVVSFFAGMRQAIGLDGQGIWLSGTSTAFDISVLELFGSLCHGRTVALLGETVLGQVEDPRYTVPSLVGRHGVTHFQCTPSQARILLLDAGGRAALASLRQLVVGGEALPQDLADELSTLVSGEVVNAYGPTETTVWSTTVEVHPREPVRIGRPIANTVVFVVDGEGRPVPYGATGELWIGGPGVTRGYRGRPDLTAERFVDRADLGGRLYKTGDLVRYTAGGQLLYLGRNDHQVKIRGFRVETGEIEAVIRKMVGVVDVVVVAKGEATSKRLVAYLVTRAPFAGDGELRVRVRAELPEYMVPAAVVHLDALPLTPNGKVDRKALPDVSPESSPSHGYVGPANQIERDLQTIWQEALGIHRISVTDDFFDLGGHSLLAVKIFDEIHRVFDVRLTMALLFDHPTVRALAAELDEHREIGSNADGVSWTTVVPIQPAGSLPPFFCVAGLGGNPMNLRHLCQVLGEEQPFYGLQHRGVDGRLKPHRSIDAMAREFVDDVRKVQPHGPYYLGGYSAGGLAAYEMARLLRAAGEPVALLVLFDTSNPTILSWSRRARLEAHLANYRRVGPTYIRVRVAAMIERQFQQAARALKARLAVLYPFEFRNDAVVEASLEAERNYEPSVYEGNVFLVQADSDAPALLGIGYPLHESNGWRKLVRGELEIVQVESGHQELLSEAVSTITGEFVRQALEKARARWSERKSKPPIAPSATASG